MDDACAADLALAASVMDAMSDPVVAVGPDTTLLYANRAAEARFGWAFADLVGTTVAHLAHPDDLETALHSLGSVLEKESGTLIDLRLRDASGDYFRFEVRGRTWIDGPVEGAVILNLREITDRSGWDLSGGDTSMLGTVLEHLPTVTLILDADGTVRGANRALTRMLHRSLEETRDRPFFDLVATNDHRALGDALADLVGTAGSHQMEVDLLTDDGTPRPVHLVAVDLTTDRTVRGLVLVAHEISALVTARQELHHLAEHDDLTGLPNRSSLRDHLARILADPAAGGHTVIFGDVDGLKVINDRHGHQAGDALLVTVAERLRQVVRPQDLVARLSGDEFVLVLATDDPGAIRAVEARIEGLMEEPIVLPDGQRTTASISIGVAPVDSNVSAEELLAAADAAMYVTKRQRMGHPGHGAA